MNKGLSVQTYPSIPASIVMDSSSSTALRHVWIGAAGSIKVSQVTTFGILDLSIIVTVTLLNQGTSNMTVVDYMRNVNPNPETVRA